VKNILLFEKFLDSHYAPLYHAKNKKLALDIFKNDIIIGNIAGGEGKKLDFRNGKHYTTNKYGKNNIVGVSLTRDKNLRFNPQTEAVSDLQFTFDTQKLRNKFRLIPFDYYGYDLKNVHDKVMKDENGIPMSHRDKKKEWEELLVGDLTNVHKYVTNIEFNSDTITEFYAEKDKIDFLWSVGKYLEKYPHITVSSVSYFGRDNDKINKEFFFNWMNKIKVGDFKDIPAKVA
jgi:hypothetical protein